MARITKGTSVPGTNKPVYVVNAFSVQMLKKRNLAVQFTEVDRLPEGLTSAIGHEDTACLLGYEVNRQNITLDEGDVIYIAQLIGGRLPLGCTELPEGYRFVFVKARVFSLTQEWIKAAMQGVEICEYLRGEA